MITCLSLIGTIANIKKKRWCFIIWAGTNAMWATVDWVMKLYAQSFLFAVYFCLSIWGMMEWKRGENE